MRTLSTATNEELISALRARGFDVAIESLPKRGTIHELKHLAGFANGEFEWECVCGAHGVIYSGEWSPALCGTESPIEPVETIHAIAEPVQDDPYADDEDDLTYSGNYCEHGTFVGNPYGPDYLCGYCEAY